MSFRKMLKSKGPKIDPCGTPSLWDTIVVVRGVVELFKN